MSELSVGGIPVSFPFEPYEVQKAYMEKVIECLQNSTNALLESPTGTGKTLCLLCSSLAWLTLKKAQLQMNAQLGNFSEHCDMVTTLKDNFKSTGSKHNKDSSSWGMPKIVYASRTHSQLTQAIQELKRSSYRHVKVAVLGSRDQMCIHPEVSKETSHVNKVYMCQLKVKSRTCHFYNNFESKKEEFSKNNGDIHDIEDLVTVGKKLKCCPYYLAKELKQNADIVFMPYNYILDSKSRKANGVELLNNVVILDEAHNVEKMCEEAASLQVRSSDIALCIDEITHIMKSVSEGSERQDMLQMAVDTNQPKDFTCDDLCVLKEMILNFEKAVDEINIATSDGSTYPGGFIFDLLTKAEIRDHNQMSVNQLIDNLIQYLSNASASPFQRKGVGLQKLADLLHLVYSSTSHTHKERVKFCYKVHVQVEDKKSKRSDSWSVLKAPKKSAERVLSYWCFSPGFGMKQLIDQNVRSIILTSGTLAPLKPTVSELGIPISVQLENPHVVKPNQIYVKIITNGPDATQLNSNYQNRDNPKYISSLGRTILCFCQVVPDGLLVFFPSYPIMAKCQEQWQNEGIWSSIASIKPIFVEPQQKDTFNSVMSDYYSKINEPSSRGACFLAVCRGKVSEGLDFADINGRAVIVTGLPYPPLKDPRIILKKKYLEEMRAKDKEFLSGDEWYSLEASRAVNQAIGRVIRHKNDYGAILLCDTRFTNPKLKSQLSAWLRDHLTVSKKFGETVSEVCKFFKNAESSLPPARLRPLLPSEVSPSTWRGGPGAGAGAEGRLAPLHAHGAFSATSSRPANRAQQASHMSVSQYPSSNSVHADFSIEFYKAAQVCVPSASECSAARATTRDLLTALDCQSHSDSSFKKRQHDVGASGAGATEPMVNLKKRKLKMKPFGFDTCLQGVTEVQGLAQGHEGHGEGQAEGHACSLVEYVRSVKRALPAEQYRAFAGAVSAYRAADHGSAQGGAQGAAQGGGYATLRAVLERVFASRPALHPLLRTMTRFLRPQHKDDFQTYLDSL